MRRLIRFVILAIAVLLPSAAHAQNWQSTVRPDAKTGESRMVLVGDLGKGAALFAQCDATRTPLLAFIWNDTHNFPARPNDRGVMLAFDIDGFRSGGEGVYYDHGGGYLGLQISDRATVAKIVGDIAKAKFGINLTITNPGHAQKLTFAGGLNGAGRAAKLFADFCFKGGTIANTPTEPPPPTGTVSAPTSKWRVYQAASGGSLVLAGETDPKEGTLYFACTNKQLTLIYLSDKPRELPFDRNARSVNLTMEIDGFSWGGEAGYYEDERGAGIAFGQGAVITDILSILSIAQGDIKMTLLGIQGAPYVRTFGATGAADAGRAFLDNCR
jgi:hypothetical protein